MSAVQTSEAGIRGHQRLYRPPQAGTRRWPALYRAPKAETGGLWVLYKPPGPDEGTGCNTDPLSQDWGALGTVQTPQAGVRGTGLCATTQPPLFLPPSATLNLISQFIIFAHKMCNSPHMDSSFPCIQKNPSHSNCSPGLEPASLP